MPLVHSVDQDDKNSKEVDYQLTTLNQYRQQEGIHSGFAQGTHRND